MRLSRLTLLPAATLLVAACATGTGSTSSPTAAPSASPSAPSSASPSAETRIDVSLTDGLRIEPATMTVPAGVPVTFAVTNTGSLDHEFYLGDEDAQAEHEQEMLEMGGMGHDEPDGISVMPGETKELTHTFASTGETFAGCHVAGHYAGGMRAEITVSG